MKSPEVHSAVAAVVARLGQRFAPQLADTSSRQRITRRAAERLIEQIACRAVPSTKPVTVPAPQPLKRQTTLPAAELQALETAFALANFYRIPSVTTAFRDYIAGPAPNAPSVQACVAEYLAMKRTEGWRPATLDGYRKTLREFSRRFGRSRPAEIELHALASFLLRLPNPASVATRWRIVAKFFHWLIRRNYAWENLVMLTMKCPRTPPTRGSVYTPTQAEWILTQTKDTDQIGFWALALFSGMRFTEIKRLGQHPTPWLLVRLTTSVIEIPGTIAKKRPRLATILPVLRQWLRWIKKRNIPFFPVNGDDKVSELRRRLALRWPFAATVVTRKNVARRSYISYRLALPFASYTEVAAAAGNTEAIIRKFYRCPVSRADAESYFTLTPTKIASLARLGTASGREELASSGRDLCRAT